MQEAKLILTPCQTCLRSKRNNHTDRRLISALPLPQVINDLIYVDFISMDPYNHFDYVLTIVDAFSKFVKFIPCTKNITGETTLKLIYSEWISNFDKPREILSDNDVRFSQEKGFYQSAFKALGIEVRFGIPRHPQSNGLCERINRAFIQNMRALSIDCNTMNWPKLCPFVSWLINSQVSGSTGYTTSELFLGRPSWKLDKIPDVFSNPTVDSWLSDLLEIQESANKRLQHNRAMALRRVKKKGGQEQISQKANLCWYTNQGGHKRKFPNWKAHG
jgi:transposase InsO family protein